ncbi:4-alpha-glucanotransferase [Sideroxydans lithotrophicus]|nr:4-alpha-glucanotransferase [Sideroxydans lithotrophicus]
MNMIAIRASGILLHPTSLPGQFGSGDIGANAYRFVDWLVSAGQTYWQMLPLGEVGSSNSPYTSCSAFAGNPLLIDLEELAKQGWLDPQELIPDPGFKSDRANFDLVKPYRLQRLQLAAQRFFSRTDDTRRSEYQAFCESEKHWLDDFALFKAIEHHEQFKEWDHWPELLVRREPGALADAKQRYADEVDFCKFCQWCFYRQWLLLKNYANDRGIRIIGDVPIFVSYQSADVWEHQDLFELDASGRPIVVAGVPPDYFSETGQLWGNPLYRWDIHEQTGYTWWIERLSHAFRLFDLVRIDHFRGFVNYWATPAGAANAINGEWVLGPGEKLFEAFQQAFGNLPIIAEDLGLITPEVIELRDKFNLPGMRILQFAFGDNDSNYFLPHHYTANSVAYTGTHDNDTTLGWWNSAKDHEKSFAKFYLHSEGREINRDMMDALADSAANTVIFPLQDVLGLDSSHRMNFPGTIWGNWEWRFSWDQIQDVHTEMLSSLTATHKRNPRIAGDS